MSCDSVFDVRKLRSGNVFEAYYAVERPASGRNASVDDTDPVLSDSPASGEVSETAAPAGRRLDNIPKDMVPEYIVYERDAMTDVVFHCRKPYGAWLSEKPVTVERKYAEVTIKSSLWEDMLEAGVSPLLILQLSDIYAWTVDFFALQKDDSFRVLYDEKSCDGRVVAVDTVRYAVFTHAGEEFPAIMFDQGDGGNIYWNAKGESMRKEFLKAPLQYSRISSGFSYARRHPITRRVQPHTGVDYAAPAGTPVMSIGDGKVISAKNEGAGGNTVRIRHNSVYTTAYLHLSRFASGIRAGVMVHQGDVIGVMWGPPAGVRDLIWISGCGRTVLRSIRLRWNHLLQNLSGKRTCLHSGLLPTLSAMFFIIDCLSFKSAFGVSGRFRFTAGRNPSEADISCSKSQSQVRARRPAEAVQYRL